MKSRFLALALVALATPHIPAADDTDAPTGDAPTTTTTTTTTTESTPAPSVRPPSRREHARARRIEEAPRMRVLDIRLGLGATPGPSRVHDDYESGAGSSLPTGGYDYQLKKKAGGYLQVGFMSGKLGDHGGLIWGIGLRSSGFKMDVDATPGVHETQDLSYSTFGPLATIGYGYAFNPIFHIETGPYLSVGAARADWFDRDATSTYREATADGAFAQAGVRLGGYFTIVRHLVLGMNLEYGSSIAALTADHSASSGKSKLTIRTHGVGGGLDVGFRF